MKKSICLLFLVSLVVANMAACIIVKDPDEDVEIETIETDNSVVDTIEDFKESK